MEIKTRIGSVIGESDDTHWGETIKTPYAYGVIEVEDEGHGAQMIGMRVLVGISKLFETSPPPLSLVTSSLERIIEKGVTSLLLCIPLGSTMAVLVHGVGAAYVKRDGHISPLLVSEGSISGKSEIGDMFFLMTKTCMETMPVSEIIEAFDAASAQDVAEKLTVRMHTKNGSIGYAGFCVEVTDMADADWKKENAAEQVRESLVAQPIIGTSRRFPFSRHKGNVSQIVKTIWHRLRHVNIKITAVLIAIFFFSVGIGLWREAAQSKDKETVMVLDQAKKAIDEGTALLTLNTLKSKEKFIEARTLLDGKKSVVASNTKEGRQMAELYRLIEESLPLAAQENTVTPELFFDIGLTKSGSKIDAMQMSGDALVLLDTGNKALFRLTLSSKRAELIAGGALFSGAVRVDMVGNTAYVLTDKGINAVNALDKTVKELVIKKSDQWQTIDSIVAFGGNVYLLDTGKSRVWKYVAIEKKDASASADVKPAFQFSDIKEYLNPDTLPDLSLATTMSIDGSVFMGSTNGKIWRFTQGKDDSKEPAGVEPAFGSDLRVFTSDELDFVYILDKEKNRVVVLDKDFVYKAQYLWINQFSPDTIIVSEKLRKIFLTSEGKLYSIDIK